MLSELIQEHEISRLASAGLPVRSSDSVVSVALQLQPLGSVRVPYMLDGLFKIRIRLCDLYAGLPCILCIADVLRSAQDESYLQLIQEVQCYDASQCRLAVLTAYEHLYIFESEAPASLCIDDLKCMYEQPSLPGNQIYVKHRLCKVNDLESE